MKTGYFSETSVIFIPDCMASYFLKAVILTVIAMKTETLTREDFFPPETEDSAEGIFRRI